jgi:CelD/BcsL family acetyltransferase involved in cellulose biosynthesis
MDMSAARLDRMGYAAAPASERVPAALKAALEQLAAKAGQGNPFYHPALLEPALAHLDPDERVRILTASDERGLLAAMPVIASARHGRVPLSNSTNWLHPHCFFGAPLLRDGSEEAGWAGLLAQLDKADWSGHFLHLTAQDADGVAMQALQNVCARDKRPIQKIAHYERAMLSSSLSGEEYWEAQVRPKKRKELRRLVNRLEEVGAVVHSTLTEPDRLTDWCDDFLTLEASGWKGSNGTAIASHPATSTYFRQALANAARAGILEMLRIDVNGHAIAMLVNFRHGEGGYSYKIAIDEKYGRYSPGVLIEIDNLHRVLGGKAVAWMDSCATPDHPLIDGLWAERRTIAQYRIGLRGTGLRALSRAASFTLAGAIEHGRSLLRRKTST